MNAVILVGGEGTRLLPLTCHTPKSMVPVLNRPFLEHILSHLKTHGIETVILALGHLSELVVKHFGDGEEFGVRLVYSVEEQPLGTAGPVKLAERYLQETFLVLNGDVFADFDITSIVRFHRAKHADATLTLTHVDDPTIYGVVESSPQGRVLRFIEKPKRDEVTSNMINAGLYVLEPAVLDYIEPDTKVMFERTVFPALLKARRPMYAYGQKGYWIDIGTPQKYLQLNLDLLRRAPEPPGPPPRRPGLTVTGPVLMPDDCVTEEGVQIAGPVVIGPSCRIGRESTIAGSVLWDRVSLGPRSRVTGSILANGTLVGDGAAIEDSVVSDHSVISRGATLEPGSKLWPGTNCEPT